MPKENPKRPWPAKNTDEYSEKRSQNNVAVRRSREKAKLKQAETQGKVEGLKVENVNLEHKVETLKKELSVLKDLFTAHASGAAAASSVNTNNSIPPTASPQKGDAVLLDHIYTKDTTIASSSPT
ncbi:CCAAT/enhancer-binding protein homolog 2-like [Watersipora subatra]|uniref:CCAAT/enhancer-binding protein homolog 2-like n=1 Tax=Watersipora subatra TaxID=2589382 RepID=UPI00355B5DA1